MTTEPSINTYLVAVSIGDLTFSETCCGVRVLASPPISLFPKSQDRLMEAKLVVNTSLAQWTFTH
jgi:hypothetical protein